MLTAHEGNDEKIIVPEGKFNIGLLFNEARTAEINRRPRLNFPEEQ